MALGPGFVEWRKQEDKRFMDMLIKKFENEGQLKVAKVEPAIKDKKYYETQARQAHKKWEEDGFKLGLSREAYMAAHTELANFISGL